MPSCGAAPVSARGVVPFAHVLAYAETADPARTSHSRALLLTLAGSARMHSGWTMRRSRLYRAMEHGFQLPTLSRGA
jgi:hypothetical protein